MQLRLSRSQPVKQHIRNLAGCWAVFRLGGAEKDLVQKETSNNILKQRLLYCCYRPIVLLESGFLHIDNQYFVISVTSTGF